MFKTKFQLIAFEDLIGLLYSVIHESGSLLSGLPVEGHSEGLYKMEGLYKKKSGVRELFEKEEKGLLLGQDVFFLGRGKGKGFMQIASGGWRESKDRLPYCC